MYKKAVSGIMLTILFICLLSVALNIQPAKSEPRTIIVPDDYPTIQEAINNANAGDIIYVRAGIYYENVIVNKTVSLVGEKKSTTIIDGKGMAYVINVTANKVNISEFTIRNANTGLYLWNSGGHNISCNIIANNLWCGIHLRTSTGNTIENNVVTNNRATAWWGGSGIHLEGFSSANRITNNVISNNTWGLVLSASDLNILSGNKLINNTYGLTIEHLFDNDIDTSNTINGKPIYYLSNQKNLVIDPATFPHVGYLGIIKSENITVKNLNLTGNGHGILFAYTNKSIIQNVNLQHNRIGILLFHSSENIIEMNTISENQIEGILIDHSNRNLIRCNSIVGNYYGIGTVSGNKNNHIYHNNFISNTKQVGYRSSEVRDGKPVYAEDVWDDGYPSGGNYWSDYNGTDFYSGPFQNETGNDGIGDTPYVIDENNVDHYPLMNPYTITPPAPLVINATVDVNPKALNLRSRGKWITAYIELPEGYNIQDINASTIMLNDAISAKPKPIAVGDHDEDGILDLMVKFDRTNVISYILANVNNTKLIEERFMRVTLTITGKLNDGTPFKGSDIIKIVMPMPRAIYKIFLFPI